MNIRNLATSNKFFGFQEGRRKTEKTSMQMLSGSY